MEEMHKDCQEHSMPGIQSIQCFCLLVIWILACASMTESSILISACMTETLIHRHAGAYQHPVNSFPFCITSDKGILVFARMTC